MSYLHYLCMLAHSGVQQRLSCVFALFFFVLPVSLDYPLLIAPLVFTNVYSIFYNKLKPESSEW